MPGIPTAYIEASYRGHKATPGKYKLTLEVNGKALETEAVILANPLYPTTPQEYVEYDRVMSDMEKLLTQMHSKTNRLFRIQNRIKELLKSIPDEKGYAKVREQGNMLAETLRKWDEELVQRKSKAYDDVENFPNKFTAEYLFLINQTESDIPRVTNASKERRKELEAQWKKLEAQANKLIQKDLPAYNKLLWEKKIGAIWMTK